MTRKVHILTLSSPDLEDKLPILQRLARQVFEPETPEAEYDARPSTERPLQLETWRERLKGKGAALLYVTNQDLSHAEGEVKGNTTRTEDDTSTDSKPTKEGERVVAFFSAHPRLHHSGSASSLLSSASAEGELNGESSPSYHIYLAAVHPSARGGGLFPLLLEATKKRAREEGYPVLTVATIPERFPRMYGILSREGSGWEVLEWKDAEESKGMKKVVMWMRLDGAGGGRR